MPSHARTMPAATRVPNRRCPTWQIPGLRRFTHWSHSVSGGASQRVLTSPQSPVGTDAPAPLLIVIREV